MMIRPVDQARLLFLYLLRGTTAAMATVRNEGTISLRLARKSDIPLIQKCNLATLPENYSQNFYSNHIRQWPDLALVAERIHVGNNNNNNNMNNYNDNKFNQYYNPNGVTQEGKEIIGYVLGKVEETYVNNNNIHSNNSQKKNMFDNQGVRLPRSVVSDDEDDEMLSSYLYQRRQQNNCREVLGHVTSLAVLKPYRRCGVAAELMRQLHYHMQESYPASAGVGLHVRVSNIAACRLYQQTMGYQIQEVIPGYYQDGEDAYFMRKPFTHRMMQHRRMDDTTNNNRRRTNFDNNGTNPNQVSLYTTSSSAPQQHPSRISKMKRAFGKLTLRGGTSKNQIANWIPFSSTATNHDTSTIKSSTEFNPSTDFQLPRILSNKQNDAAAHIPDNNRNTNNAIQQINSDTNDDDNEVDDGKNISNNSPQVTASTC